MDLDVEILYFEGCPNHGPAEQLVAQVLADLAPSIHPRLVRVTDAKDAERERFLGSPTIRVNGRDVEPGAEARTDYGFACRVFQTDSGLASRPDERWLREAVIKAQLADAGRGESAHAQCRSPEQEHR